MNFEDEKNTSWQTESEKESAREKEFERFLEIAENVQREFLRRGFVPKPLMRVLLGESPQMTVEQAENFKTLPLVSPDDRERIEYPYSVSQKEVTLVAREKFLERAKEWNFDLNEFNQILQELGVSPLDFSKTEKMLEVIKDKSFSQQLQENILEQLKEGKDISKLLEKLYGLVSLPDSFSQDESIDLFIVAGAISPNRVKGVAKFLRKKPSFVLLTGGNSRYLNPQKTQIVSEFEMQMTSALAEGIDPRQIIGEDISFSTWQNVDQALPKIAWLGYMLGKKLTIATSTSPYHSKRFHFETKRVLENFPVEKLGVMNVDSPYQKDNYWKDGEKRNGKLGIWFVLEENRKFLYDLLVQEKE